MTHDHIRNGTATLFAALNVFEGKVIGPCMQRHRRQEFIESYLDGKLYLTDTLAQPVSGRIGVWSKADSVVYVDAFALRQTQ
jgi:hypothetical protein